MKLPTNVRKKIVKRQLGIDLEQKLFYEIGTLKDQEEIVFLTYKSEPIEPDQMQEIWNKLIKPLNKKDYSLLLTRKKFVATKKQLRKMEDPLLINLKPFEHFKGKDYSVISLFLNHLEIFQNKSEDFEFIVRFKGVRVWKQ